MELTPHKIAEPQVESGGRRSFVLALFGLSGAAVGALLAIPLLRFLTYPMRKSGTATTWSNLGPVQDFASHLPASGLLGPLGRHRGQIRMPLPWRDVHGNRRAHRRTTASLHGLT